MYCLRVFLAAAVMVIAPAAFAQTSPAGQVYEAEAMGSDTGYLYRFLTDGTLQVDPAYGGMRPPDYANGSGRWEMAADGAVTITAQNVEMMPGGEGTVTCMAWPDVPVGPEFTEMPCWWPAEEPDGPLIRRE